MGSRRETNHMQSAKTPEERVLETLFQKLADDPTFSKNTLKRLAQAREGGKLPDLSKVLEACRVAGVADATDIPS
jgi:hypothetical protein